MRLLRSHLRAIGAGGRNPVAVHGARARRDGAALHGRRVPHRGGLLRAVRPRPHHRRRDLSGAVSGERPTGPRDHQARGLHAAARRAGRALSLLADHGARGVPLAYPDQDRSGGRATGGGPDPVRGAQPGGCRALRDRQRRSGGGRLPPGPCPGRGPHREHPARAPLHAVSLRRLGRDGPAGRRRRADDHGLGPVSKQPHQKFAAVWIRKA